MSQYIADIANAGIVAPASWLEATGPALCSDWANDPNTSDVTDPLVLAGGILPQHLALFDTITNQDLCPGLYVNIGG